MEYMVSCNVKVSHFPNESVKYLNFDGEVITRAPIVNKILNSRHSEVSLDKFYYLYEVHIFKIDNALVSQILFKIFIEMDAFVYMKQRKDSQDVPAVYLDIHKQYLGTDHVARQTAEADRKLQLSSYDSEKKEWDWDKFVTLHKENHAIIDSLTDYGYS